MYFIIRMQNLCIYDKEELVQFQTVERLTVQLTNISKEKYLFRVKIHSIIILIIIHK